MVSTAVHFVWAIPERNLRLRLHRVTASTLIVWGQGDGVVTPGDADDFAAGIGDADRAPGRRASRNVDLEALDRTASAVLKHLKRVHVPVSD